MTTLFYHTLALLRDFYPHHKVVLRFEGRVEQSEGKDHWEGEYRVMVFDHRDETVFYQTFPTLEAINRLFEQLSFERMMGK